MRNHLTTLTNTSSREHATAGAHRTHFNVLEKFMLSSDIRRVESSLLGWEQAWMHDVKVKAIQTLVSV